MSGNSQKSVLEAVQLHKAVVGFHKPPAHLDPAFQLAKVGGLGEIVVRALVQCVNDILLLRL